METTDPKLFSGYPCPGCKQPVGTNQNCETCEMILVQKLNQAGMFRCKSCGTPLLTEDHVQFETRGTETTTVNRRPCMSCGDTTPYQPNLTRAQKMMVDDVTGCATAVMMALVLVAAVVVWGWWSGVLNGIGR